MGLFQKKETGYVLRLAREEDAEGLLQVYAPYVEDTAISFEYTVPSVEEFRSRIRRIRERYPYLVAEREGRILGYTYAAPFKERAAYGWACETTIYIARDAQGIGLGRHLYESLELALSSMGITNVNACIGVPEVEDEHLTNNSLLFHSHMGYQMVGRFHRCGYKFDTWYDMVWMEKIIAEHLVPAVPVRPFQGI